MNENEVSTHISQQVPAGISRDAQAETLLLVDDEINILSALKRVLRRNGRRILTADSAHMALDVLAQEDVHVVVSDHRMPGMSGTELLSKVKETHPETVRMMLSGYADAGAKAEGLDGGAMYKFLAKPWNEEELCKQIEGAFHLHQSRSPLSPI
jgi:response regulator RpfG family c-di-GMP phosphodiesterase